MIELRTVRDDRPPPGWQLATIHVFFAPDGTVAQVKEPMNYLTVAHRKGDVIEITYLYPHLNLDGVPE